MANNSGILKSFKGHVYVITNLNLPNKIVESVNFGRNGSIKSTPACPRSEEWPRRRRRRPRPCRPQPASGARPRRRHRRLHLAHHGHLLGHRLQAQSGKVRASFVHYN
jgi:hypothetical protein